MKVRLLGSPSGGFVVADLYSRRRRRRVQYLAGHFWVRWRREYVRTLQRRSKWTHPRRNLNAGDVVLVKDEDAQRNDWPLGPSSLTPEIDLPTKFWNFMPATGGGGERRYLRKCNTGRLRPEVQPLTLLYTILAEKALLLYSFY